MYSSGQVKNQGNRCPFNCIYYRLTLLVNPIFFIGVEFCANINVIVLSEINITSKSRSSQNGNSWFDGKK